ncbi:hypothetical protein Bsp3421_006352 [Burkholderia sp. FERM BP-3421]|uniref:hypothetical protein n=1 Tax=Burkholderia sp. FERM BP-3421 TaxID=1494466 RepID=UPI00235E3735|nr:hypothetical protein [Burkholderia sp. FERM BP-3421]WDD96154.1 hypothetical protein Bsp3421_006352 [Burkholderia sp. FERM BP-3421]
MQAIGKAAVYSGAGGFFASASGSTAFPGAKSATYTFNWYFTRRRGSDGILGTSSTQPTHRCADVASCTVLARSHLGLPWPQSREPMIRRRSRRNL